MSEAPAILEVQKAAETIIRGYTQRLPPLGADGTPEPIEQCTAPAVVLARAAMLAARWWDDAHPPTEPGLYYWEHCDQYGNPRPGLYLWEEGKEPQFPTDPFKLFGPIRGAMQPWPMTPIVDGYQDAYPGDLDCQTCGGRTTSFDPLSGLIVPCPTCGGVM